MNEYDPVPAREPPLAELVESAMRKLVSAIVIAGGLIGLGLWSRSSPTPPHYQIVAAEGRIYRINMENGTVVGCEGNRCAIMLQHRQDLERDLPAPPAARQLPPPQPAPAAAPAPAAPAAGAPPAAPPAPAPARH
jgi:hypothetical protein